jgi:outer membrane lipoprotein LolB
MTLRAPPPNAVAAGIVLTLLAACATRPPAPRPSWPARLATLRALPHFDLSGRIAVSTGADGFSAGMRWSQQDTDATIDLLAPLGFGAAHIELHGEQLKITTSRGERLEREAATAELASMLGFEPPLASLRYWMLGASDPATAAEETLDLQQRLVHLVQDGWRIDYADYAQVRGQWLPRRLTVQREPLRLRLVIESWRL